MFCGIMAGMKKLMIIGGGSAGLVAALEAAREVRAHRAAVEVVLCEADERVGRSILATGNGRCNFSNAHVDARAYRNAEFIGEALGALGACDEGDPVHAFFANLGLVWREESEGRLYPLANKASSVLDVLRTALHVAGVRELRERRVTRIDAPEQAKGRFHLRCADGTVEHADAVIVAVGGRAAGSLELSVELPRVKSAPVLGPLRTDAAVVKSLNNIRVRCAISLTTSDGKQKAREEGEVLFREYGVSGIAVFNLSRFAKAGDTLLIDLVPQVAACDIEPYLVARRKRLLADGRALDGDWFLQGLVLPAVGRAVLREAGLKPEAPFQKADVPALACALKGFPLTVRGIGDAKQCQVMRGGFAVESFDARTLEARAVPGLHVVGEALDVDAPCGGYNLHWAWASGMLAGRVAAQRLAEAEGVSHA